MEFLNFMTVDTNKTLGALVHNTGQRTPHVQNYNARYGILLDMVGGKDATFYYEGYSARTARSEMKKIWKKAHELDMANIL